MFPLLILPARDIFHPARSNPPLWAQTSNIKHAGMMDGRDRASTASHCAGHRRNDKDQVHRKISGRNHMG